MANLLDRMFALFQKAVLEANGHGNKFRFNDKEIVFEPVDDKALSGLFMFIINGERFSLNDSREAKMRLAAAGLLGDMLIDKGIRGLADIAEFKHKRNLAKARKHNDALWGPFSPTVWRWHDPAAHRPDVAQTAIALLPFSVMPGGIPKSKQKARDLGADFPRVSDGDWTAALRLAKRLANLESVKARLEAARDATQTPEPDEKDNKDKPTA